MLFERLNSASSPAEIASAYREWSAANGGDTSANQAAAQNYLSSLGVNSGTIGAAYKTYQAAPSAPVYHAPIAAPTPAPAPAPVYQAPVAAPTPAPAPVPAPVYQAPVAPQPQRPQQQGNGPLVSSGPGGGYDPWARPGPVAQQPAYASLSRASSPAEIASAYKQWAAANGGDTTENQRAAESYLLSLGINQNTINDAYNTYKAPAPQTTQQGASYATTQAAQQPVYAGLSSASSPTDIANAYRQWSSSNGGDTTDNQRTAESYLSSLGLGRDAIYSAYDAYKAPQPLYAGLNNNSNANDIAAAYREWSSSNGGDTTDNQRAAESYLQSLGIGSGAINDAYNAYRGPLTTTSGTTAPAQNGPAAPIPGPLTTTAQPEYKMPMLNALYQGQQQRMLSTAPTFNFQQPAGTGGAQPAAQGALTTVVNAV